jgi:hypothetical protein
VSWFELLIVQMIDSSLKVDTFSPNPSQFIAELQSCKVTRDHVFFEVFSSDSCSWLSA